MPAPQIDLRQLLAIGQLGAGTLALPNRIKAAQQETSLNRALLSQLGLAPEQVEQMAPEPGLGWLSAGRGDTAGKILGGVGDVGSILTAILGGNVGVPRPPLAEIATIAQLGAKRNTGAKVGAALRGGRREEAAAAAAEAGDIGSAAKLFGGAPKPPAPTLMRNIEAEADQLGKQGLERTRFIQNRYSEINSGIAGAGTTARVGATIEANRNKPLSPADLRRFPGATAGQSLADVEGKVPTDPATTNKFASQLARVDVALDDLDRGEQTLSTVLSSGQTPTGFAEAITTQPVRLWLRSKQGQAAATTYLNLGRSVQNFLRAMSEVGNLSEGEQSTFAKLLPDSNDTVEEAQNKINDLRTRMKSIRDRLGSGGTTTDTSTTTGRGAPRVLSIEQVE